jgi:integrase
MHGIPLHALRHTHASQLIDAGVDIVTVSKRLGHGSPCHHVEDLRAPVPQGGGKAAAAINAALSGKASA